MANESAAREDGSEKAADAAAAAAIAPSASIPVPSSGASRILPRTIGSYTLFEHVGRGGMAELFLARSESALGATRLAVVKLILPAFSDDPKFAEMLIHEAKLAASLSHRHIVQVLELGRGGPEGDERLFIAMEYVEGFDLNVLLRKCSEMKEGLPAPHALGIVADILEGLDYAHRRPLGIVHRDVSPSNILISYEGEVKLCDFGIAHANDLVREEASEALKGKAGYMSPEHARGEALDARADVFAAGIILWELLSGRRLYKPRSEVPLLEQARKADIPPIPEKGLPDHEELQRIVSKALSADRDNRYATTGAFQRDLEAYLAKAGLLASRLKLGEWLSETFGTELIEERRASERRLPKSIPPPPRSSSSGAARLRSSSSVPAAFVPPAPLLPAVVSIVQEESIPLFMPAPPEESAKAETEMATTTASSSSEEAPDAATAAASLANASATDDELIRWARKRGVVSFFGFFMIAVFIAVGYYLTR